MHPKSPKWLDDIATAASRITDWTTVLALADYEDDERLRAAVERQFEIVGEALVRLERADPETAARISGYRKAIGFRNRLADRYDDIDHDQAWEVVQHFLPTLRTEVGHLLHEAEATDPTPEA